MVSKKEAVKNSSIDDGKLQWIAHKEHGDAPKRIALLTVHMCGVSCNVSTNLFEKNWNSSTMIFSALRIIHHKVVPSFICLSRSKDKEKGLWMGRPQTVRAAAPLARHTKIPKPSARSLAINKQTTCDLPILGALVRMEHNCRGLPPLDARH